MAGAITDQATLDLANSLAPEDIPAKLRCAVCNKLAVNAFKLPCCDQSICQSCQAILPESCPVCQHSPLEADSCKPNKSLRMTVRAFLKSEEKKRAATEAFQSAPPQPATPAPAATAAPSEQPEAATDVATTATIGDVSASENTTFAQDGGVAAGAAHSTAGVEETPYNQTADEAETDQLENVERVNQEPDHEGEHIVETTEGDGDDQDEADDHVDIITGDETVPRGAAEADYQNQMVNGQSGYDGDQNNANGNGNGNMDWNNANGFNPMMNMPTMQNWGAFPNMMGMSPMNMGPMSMFGGFGPGGMGMQDMSGMNMGMGFGGGFGGNFGNQGMGGNFGAGYYPNAGYNQPHSMHQGAYGNQMHHQQFSNHNYQNRFQAGRGFGRGGRGGFGGRGGHVNNAQASHAPHNGNHFGGSQADDAASMHAGFGSEKAPPDGPAAERKSQSVVPVDQSQIDHTDADDGAMDTTGDQATSGEGQDVSTNGHGAEEQDGADAGAMATDEHNYQDPNSFDSAMAEQGFVSDMNYPMDPSQANPGYYGANMYQGYSGRGRGGFRGRGRGGYNNFAGQHDFTVVVGEPARAVSPPINAPTGPKAMREGLPNTGRFSRPPPKTATSIASFTQAGSVNGNEGSLAQEEPSAEAALDRSRTRSRSRSVSEGSKRKYRHRSVSATEDDETRERRRERRRREHERKYDDEPREDYAVGGVDQNLSKQERSRSSSRDRRHREKEREKDKYRSSRSHKDQDSSREHRRDRHRDDYTNGEDVHSESSRYKSRSHRDKERSRGDRDRDREREKERKRRRDRSPTPIDDKYASSRRDRREDRRERDREKVRDRDDDVMPAPCDDFKIKGSRSSHIRAPPIGPSAAFAPPTGPKKDRESDRNHDLPTGPKKGRDRARGRPDRDHRDRSDMTQGPRRPSLQSVAAAEPPAEPADPYAAEREARHRERMLKEQQRRESASTNLGKRPRDGFDEGHRASDAFNPPSGPRAERREGEAEGGSRRRGRKSRKVGHKYDDEENDEARASRVEREREAGRWG